jgi:hypothetical protein
VAGRRGQSARPRRAGKKAKPCRESGRGEVGSTDELEEEFVASGRRIENPVKVRGPLG